MIIKDAGCIKFVSAIQSIEIIETTENDRPQASQSIPEHPRASQSIAEHRRASQSIAEHRKAARGINLAGMSRIDSSNQSENGEEGGSVAQHDQRIRQHPPASASIVWRILNRLRRSFRSVPARRILERISVLFLFLFLFVPK